MKILVIGDEHTYGYGLSGGSLSYTGHFIRQISRSGQPVSVEAYAHLSITQLMAMIPTLPLSQYDLVILQLSEPAMQKREEAGCSTLAGLPYSLCPPTKTDTNGTGFHQYVRGLIDALRFISKPVSKMPISALLKQLRFYRHNVILLTSLPHRNPVGQWLRKQNRALVLREADAQLVSVFDSDSVIQPREEYFLPNDPRHLNAIGHELLGRALFDFYETAPTIVTIQPVRRE